MGCCQSSPRKSVEKLLEEPLSIKSIRLAAYNVAKYSSQHNQAKLWTLAVKSIQNHRLDLNFAPVYSPGSYTILHRNCEEVLMNERDPESLFDFLEDSSYSV